MSLHSWKRVHATEGKVGGCLARRVHSESSKKTFLPGRMQITESGARWSGCGAWTAPRITAGRNAGLLSPNIISKIADLFATSVVVVTWNCASDPNNRDQEVFSIERHLKFEYFKH